MLRCARFSGHANPASVAGPRKSLDRISGDDSSGVHHSLNLPDEFVLTVEGRPGDGAEECAVEDDAVRNAVGLSDDFEHRTGAGESSAAENAPRQQRAGGVGDVSHRMIAVLSVVLQQLRLEHRHARLIGGDRALLVGDVQAIGKSSDSEGSQK